MTYKSLHQMNLYDIFGDNPWTQEDEFMRDRAYMKKVSPKTGREMMRWVEEVCDEEEYDGSCMYDEYPDGAALEALADRVYTRAKRPEPEAVQRALIMALLHGEVCYRRCRRRDFKQRLFSK